MHLQVAHGGPRKILLQLLPVAAIIEGNKDAALRAAIEQATYRGILSNHIEFETEDVIAARTYFGKAQGRLYVVVPTAMADSSKATLLLEEFKDYSFAGWQKQTLGVSTVFVQ